MRFRVTPLLPVVLAGCLWISKSEHGLRSDADGDGIPVDEDCDDTNPNIAPGRVETPCDGLDNDCNSGTADGPATIRLLTYPDVQSALDAADAGDTVVLCPGTFRESVIARVPVILTGSAGPGDTVIDATDAGGPALEIRGAGATVRRLTLTGGTGGANPRPDLVSGATVGGGLQALEATGDVVLEDVLVAGNTAEAGAGLVGPADHALSLTRVTVSDNVATGDGGGVVLGAGALVDSDIVRNEAGGDGGGLWVWDQGAVSMQGGSIADNTAIRGGGAALGPLSVLTGAVLEANVATGAGGGVSSLGASLVDAEVSRNTAVTGGGYSGFGSLRGSTFSRNTAAQGGGLHADGDIDAEFVTVEYNTATDGDGGGVLAVDGVLDLGDSSFEFNEAAGGGGGLAVLGAQIETLRVDVVENTATDGGGLLVRSGGCVGCNSNLNAGSISGNHASGDGGGVWLDGDLVDLYGSNLVGNTADEDGGGVYVGAGGAVSFQSQALVQANVAGGVGGGLVLRSGSPTLTLISSASFRNNGADDGGAMYLADGTVRCAPCTIADHQVIGGAAVLLQSEAGSSATFEAVAAIFDGNTLYDVSAGGEDITSVPGSTFTCTTAGGCG